MYFTTLYKKQKDSLMLSFRAEAARFELAVRLPVRQFSKLVVSATHPHFHNLLLRVQI